MKIEEMSKHHAFVWNTLQLLEDGQRIIGADLQERAGIEERRTLYKVINDLRKYGYLVGSSKTAERGGYFEIRDEADLKRTLNDLRSSAYSLLETAERIESAYYGVDEEEDDEIDKETI